MSGPSPPLKDLDSLSRKDSLISHSYNTFLDLQEEDNLSIVDEMSGPSPPLKDLDCLSRKDSLTSHSYNTFLDLREEDNLSIVDEMSGPSVSFIHLLLPYLMT